MSEDIKKKKKKKKKKSTEFGIGYINDEYILSHISDFEFEDSIIKKTLSLPTWSNVHDNNKKLYEYQGYLLTINELRIKFLSKYYDVK